MGRVTVARLAPQLTAEAPEVGGTFITVLVNHIGTAGAAAHRSVTVADALRAVCGQGSLLVTGTASTVTLKSIAIVTRLAFSTVGSPSVVEAAQALASVRVTGLRVTGVNVVVALTRTAGSILLLGRSKISR